MATTDKKILRQAATGDTVQSVNDQPAAAAANPVTGSAAQQTGQQNTQAAQPAQNRSANSPAGALISLPGVSDATKQALGGLAANGYQPSQNVSAALTELNGIISRQPDAFKSQYSAQLNSLLNQILGREAFSYDAVSDPMYSMYREMYAQQGRQAMEDTMGRAAAMTGGYGNSYATTAAQQAYQGSLQQLNQIVPELYAQARQAYADEGDRLMSQYGAVGDAYNRDLTEYQTAYDRWAADRAFAQNRYEGERNFDYGSYSDMLNYWSGMADRENSQYNADREFQAQQDALRQDQANWEAQFEYGKTQDQLAQENWFKQFEAQQNAAAQDQANWEAQFEYGKTQDQLAQENWLKEFQAQQNAIAQDQANWEAQFEYGKTQDQLAQENWLKEFQAQQNAIAQDQANWQTQYDYNVQQDQLAQENWLKEYQMQMDAMGQDKAARDQEYALELALAMAEAGKTPSAELLRQAGFTQADIDAILKGSTASSGGSSSGSKKSSGSSKNTSQPSTGVIKDTYYTDRLSDLADPAKAAVIEEAAKQAAFEEWKKKYGKVATVNGTNAWSVNTVTGR